MGKFQVKTDTFSHPLVIIPKLANQKHLARCIVLDVKFGPATWGNTVVVTPVNLLVIFLTAYSFLNYFHWQSAAKNSQLTSFPISISLHLITAQMNVLR